MFECDIRQAPKSRRSRLKVKDLRVRRQIARLILMGCIESATSGGPYRWGYDHIMPEISMELELSWRGRREEKRPWAGHQDRYSQRGILWSFHPRLVVYSRLYPLGNLANFAANLQLGSSLATFAFQRVIWKSGSRGIMGMEFEF